LKTLFHKALSANMTSQSYPGLAALLTAALLSGCGAGGSGGGGGGSVACDSITGGDAAVTSTGPATNPDDAADGSLYSYGVLQLTSTAQTGSIRATAQSGVVFPAGSRAGVFTSYLNQGTSNATSLRTYLNGVPAETASPLAMSMEPAYGGTGAEFYLSFETAQPFNAVEFSETDNGANGTAHYRIYEFCSDGHA
jgi:hypothetical protein